MFPLVLHSPLIRGSVLLYLRSQKGGCYSTWDDLSCPFVAKGHLDISLYNKRDGFNFHKTILVKIAN